MTPELALVVAWWAAWTVAGAIIAPSRGFTRVAGASLGLLFSFLGVAYLALRPRLAEAPAAVEPRDPIVVRTYRGATLEEASGYFATDSRQAYANGYEVAHQAWDAGALTVTYRRGAGAPSPGAAGTTPDVMPTVILGGAVVAAAGTVLPWASAGFLVTTGVDGPDGWLVAVVAVVGGIAAIIIRRTRWTIARLVALLAGAGILFVAALDAANVLTMARGVTLGIGLVLCIVGSLMMIVGALTSGGSSSAD